MRIILHEKAIPVILVIAIMLLAGCTSNEKAMVYAIKNGDIAKVQVLLDKGVSPNLQTDDGRSILRNCSSIKALMSTQKITTVERL